VDCGFLGCDAVPYRKWLPAFLRHVGSVRLHEDATTQKTTIHRLRASETRVARIENKSDRKRRKKKLHNEEIHDLKVYSSLNILTVINQSR
jgi:hypothetical protein